MEYGAYPHYIVRTDSALSYGRDYSAAFTGRRAHKLGFDVHSERFQEALASIAREIDRAYLLGYRCFFTGMANGFDLMAARCAVECKNTAVELQLVGVIPYENQADHWDAYWNDEYARIFNCLDAAIILSKEHSPGCLRARNQFMVDRASLLIAGMFGTGRSGGTGQTLSMAERAGIEVVSI